MEMGSCAEEAVVEEPEPETNAVVEPVEEREPAETKEELKVKLLSLSPPSKLSSAKSPVCFNFQTASMSLKVGENVVQTSNSLDLDETPSYSASHPDPSCLHMALQL